jgi:hypothetical protein
MSKVLVERQIYKANECRERKKEEVCKETCWGGGVRICGFRLPGFVCKTNAVQRLDKKVSSRNGPAVAYRQRQLNECWDELLVPREVGLG